MYQEYLSVLQGESTTGSCDNNISPDSKYLFQNMYWFRWVFMGILVILYAYPIYFVYTRRQTSEMTPRSPHMILMFLVYILLDSLGNTYLFSVRTGPNA